jgi:HKD family nuclease
MATTIKFNAGDFAPQSIKAMDSMDYCYLCGRKLGKNAYHFEVNRAWLIIYPGSDENYSQGFFPVGSECAKKFDSDLLVKIGA